jgi:hypothetical protein
MASLQQIKPIRHNVKEATHRLSVPEMIRTLDLVNINLSSLIYETLTPSVVLALSGELVVVPIHYQHPGTVIGYQLLKCRRMSIMMECSKKCHWREGITEQNVRYPNNWFGRSLNRGGLVRHWD